MVILAWYTAALLLRLLYVPQHRSTSLRSHDGFSRHSHSNPALSNSPLRDSDEDDISKCLLPLSHLLSAFSRACPKPTTSWVFARVPDKDRGGDTITSERRKRNGAVVTTARRIPALAGRQLWLSALQTLRQRAAVSQGAALERPRWSTKGDRRASSLYGRGKPAEAPSP